MPKAERYTENLVERALREAGFSEDDFQFQGSYDEDIKQFLPSKRSGKDGKGRSEFIIRLNGDAADLLVIECKSDEAFHESAPSLTEISSLKPVSYAVDGVLHYMKGLRRDFNVIGVAASGTKKLKISTFKAMRGSAIKTLPYDVILKPDKYLELLKDSQGYGQKTEKELDVFTEDLHDFLRDNMELSEAYKPLIVSGILLALMDKGFETSYRRIDNGVDLSEAALEAIKRTLKRARVTEEKLDAMLSNYQFIKTNKAVTKHLSKTVAKIYRNLFYALQPTNGLDLLGKFYGEFLRYSGGDKQGLGIVLTPRHITELYASLADLNPSESVVIDPCAGTGGFLIASMADMIGKAKSNPTTIQRILGKGLLGIEIDSHMFTLACANMIFRGDGKANMYWDDCFLEHNKTEDSLRRMKPNVSLLNPPYSKKANDKHELVFVLKALDLLEPNGICIAIIPMSCVIEDDNKITSGLNNELLSRHTLNAVMSMPHQLFPDTGSVTVTVVFTAHRPHNTNKPSWFAMWTEDGFKLNKGRRVEREPGIWNTIKQHWLKTFFNQSISSLYSCKVNVRPNMEWCAEAYLATDLSVLTKQYFETFVEKYARYAFFALPNIDTISKRPTVIQPPSISTWSEYELETLFSFSEAKGPTTEWAKNNAGTTPFISAGGQNNGLICLTNYAPTHPAGSISLVTIGEGASGKSFFQPLAYCANPGKALILTNDNISWPAKLFISAVITSQEWRFSYGRACNGTRARKLKIPLPSKSDGAPDYRIMEQSIMSCPFSNIFSLSK